MEWAVTGPRSSPVRRRGPNLDPPVRKTAGQPRGRERWRAPARGRTDRGRRDRPAVTPDDVDVGERGSVARAGRQSCQLDIPSRCSKRSASTGRSSTVHDAAQEVGGGPSPVGGGPWSIGGPTRAGIEELASPVDCRRCRPSSPPDPPSAIVPSDGYSIANGSTDRAHRAGRPGVSRPLRRIARRSSPTVSRALLSTLPRRGGIDRPARADGVRIERPDPVQNSTNQ